MNHVQVWFEDSQLTLNLKKINYIVFKSRRQKFKKEFKITLNEYAIKKKVNNPKFLGVMIDEHLM